MANEIKDLLDTIKQEAADQEKAIREQIAAEIGKLKINITNLDSDLKTLIMAKGQAVPLQEPPAGKLPAPRKTDLGFDINEKFRNVVDDLLAKNNVYLYGKAGTGKTQLARNVANYLGKGEREKYYELNCSQWTSPIQIIGGFSITGPVEGQLEKAWRYGGVLILDELPKLDANTAGLLNTALSDTANDGALLTTGRGDQFPKHPDFMCIGTGNTDMKTVELKFSGNNRQDYSLVDRFTGAYYFVDYDPVLEAKLSYTPVFNIGMGIREWLDANPASIEAITLRGLLNWGRNYAVQMLRQLESPLAFYAAGEKAGSTVGKTIKDSVDSFIDSFGKDRAAQCRKDVKVMSLTSQQKVNLTTAFQEAIEEEELFIKEFARLTGYDALTGKKIGEK